MLASTLQLGKRDLAVDVVVASVSELMDETAPCLSEVERERIATIRHEGRRAAVGASLALARLVAARRLGVAPLSVPLTRRCSRCGTTDHGRPIVEGADFSISISRSIGWAAVALARGPVGIDIEPLSRTVAGSDLRPVCTPAEQDWLRSRAHPAPLRLWVLKEAIGKALGEGILGAQRWALPLEAAGELEGRLSGTSPRGEAWSATLMPASAAPIVAAVATLDVS